MTRTLAITTIAISLASTAAPALAAAYMKLGDIKGEIAAAPPAASARAREGWIEIDSYSFGAVGAGTCTGQAGPGRITASPRAGATPIRPSANRLPKVTLQVERPGGGYLEVKLENVLITSATGTASRPSETVTLDWPAPER